MLMATNGVCVCLCVFAYNYVSNFIPRYESLVPGVPDLAAEYKNKLYCFSSEKNLEKFMRYMCIIVRSHMELCSNNLYNHYYCYIGNPITMR